MRPAGRVFETPGLKEYSQLNFPMISLLRSVSFHIQNNIFCNHLMSCFCFLFLFSLIFDYFQRFKNTSKECFFFFMTFLKLTVLTYSSYKKRWLWFNVYKKAKKFMIVNIYFDFILSLFLNLTQTMTNSANMTHKLRKISP